MSIITGTFTYKQNYDNYRDEIPLINIDGSFIFMNVSVSLSKNIYFITIDFEYQDINSEYDGLAFYNSMDKKYISTTNLTIENFDGIPLSRSGNQFNAFKGVSDAKDYPTILSNTSFFCTFYNSNFNSSYINYWDTTNVINMANTFDNNKVFNQNISNWNVSNVTDMQYMFNMSIFNQDCLNNWNVSNVINMECMFYESNFFGNISKWNISKVVNTSLMFYNCTKYSPRTSSWNVESVEIMDGMFENTGFVSDSNINNWNVSNVKSMRTVFMNTPFNSDISNWNVSNVEHMNGLFQNNSKFSYDLSAWGNKLKNVKVLDKIFTGATSFNHSLELWDVSNVETMLENVILFWIRY